MTAAIASSSYYDDMFYLSLLNQFDLIFGGLLLTTSLWEITPYLYEESGIAIGDHVQHLLLPSTNSLTEIETSLPPLYHFSIPVVRFFYPEPFTASPSFLHSDLWFTHILNYQYWLWFVFCTLIVFFFLTFVATLRWCQLRIRPRRETRGVSRSKCGDLITACVPVSWATSIIVHESTDAIDFFDGFGTTEMVMGIRAYQWGWEYFYPRNLNLNYQMTPSYSAFLGNSILYCNGSDALRGANTFFKFYKYQTETLTLNPLSFLLADQNRENLLSSLTLANFGTSRLVEAVAFQATRCKNAWQGEILNAPHASQFNLSALSQRYANMMNFHAPLHNYLGDDLTVQNQTWMDTFVGSQWNARMGLNVNFAPFLTAARGGDYVQSGGAVLVPQVPSLRYPGVSRETQLSFSERNVDNLINGGVFASFITHLSSLEKPLNIHAWVWEMEGTPFQMLGEWDLNQNYPQAPLNLLMTQDERTTPLRIWNAVWETTGANLTFKIRYQLWLQEMNLEQWALNIPKFLYTRYDFLAKNDFPLWEILDEDVNNREDLNRMEELSNDQRRIAAFARKRWEGSYELDETTPPFDLFGLRFLRIWNRIPISSTPLSVFTPTPLTNQNSPSSSFYDLKSSIPLASLIALRDGDWNSTELTSLRRTLASWGLMTSLQQTLTPSLTTIQYLTHFTANFSYPEHVDTGVIVTSPWIDEIGGDEMWAHAMDLKRPTTALTKNRGAILKVFNNFFDEQRGHVTLAHLSTMPRTPAYFTNPFPPFSSLVRKNHVNFIATVPPRNEYYGSFTSPIEDRMAYPSTAFPFLLGSRSDSGKHRFFDWYARWVNFDVALAPEATYSAAGVKHFHKGYVLDKNTNEMIREIDRYTTRLAKARKNYTLNWMTSSAWQATTAETRLATNEDVFGLSLTLCHEIVTGGELLTFRRPAMGGRSFITPASHDYVWDYETRTLGNTWTRDLCDSITQRNYIIQLLSQHRKVLTPLFDDKTRTLSHNQTPTAPLSTLRPYTQTSMRRGITAMNKIHATGAIALPSEIRLQILASSRDVIHSWAVPSAGIKIDCVPGYSSHRTFIFFLGGVYWGQCMEVCGRFHHWMPIIVYFLRRDLFVLWCSHFALQRKLGWDYHALIYPQKTALAPISYGTRSWIREL